MTGAPACNPFGSASDGHVERCQPRVGAINALEGELVTLSDGELRARTAEFKQQLEAISPGLMTAKSPLSRTNSR